MITTCPDIEAWQNLLKGAVPEAQAAQLNAHMDSCTACQRTLEGLVASHESWSGAAKDLQERPLDPTGKLGQVMAQLKARTAQGETQAEGSAAPGSDFSFLQPSKVAGNL